MKHSPFSNAKKIKEPVNPSTYCVKFEKNPQKKKKAPVHGPGSYRYVTSPLRGGVGVQHAGTLHPRPHCVHAGAQRLLLKSVSAALHALRYPEHEESPSKLKISPLPPFPPPRPGGRVCVCSPLSACRRAPEELKRVRARAHARAHTHQEMR